VADAEPLALLLLPSKLEDFRFAAHARDLLEIPRAVALEPPRMRQSGTLAEMLAARYARRVRLPGEARVIVLYHPRQGPLARALLATRDAELWYARPDRQMLEQSTPRHREELMALDDRAAERATEILLISRDGDPREQNLPLRRRLIELGVISAKPFVPGARINFHK
jgi:hypothetical protein